MKISLKIMLALLVILSGMWSVRILKPHADSKASSKADVQASSNQVVVHVDPDPAKASPQTLDKRMFGKFFEYNGRDAYPGIYADHLANGSFEVWNTSKGGHRTAVLYRDTKHYSGIAFPWEPIENQQNVTYKQVVGGINGRKAEPDLEKGHEVPPADRPNPAGISQPRFEQINVHDGRGGVLQRVALPDNRTMIYNAKFSVRGDLSGSFEVRLEDQKGTVLAKQSVPVTSGWQRHEIKLKLRKKSGSRYQGSPFGEYQLAFVAKGTGHVDLDWAMLMSGDAVKGMFNPTTIQLLKKFNVTAIRWPGGNFASQYHWRDGVGPLKDRPVVPNVNWGGFERNYLGTDEFLQFCKIAGVEPIITVGSWAGISPQEAANWVQYVNGDQSTPMGRLRAENGHPESYNVTHWQIGNEVYGDYQVGHTDVYKYAERYKEIYQAMKAADPNIEINASGIDPWYTDFNDGSGNRNFGQPPTWNKVLFDLAGNTVHGLDIHRYTRGIVVQKNRVNWLKQYNKDPIGYNEVLVNFPTEYEQLLRELRQQAADRGIKNLRIEVGEWNLQPRVNKGWPRAGYPTMAHAAYMAGTFNAFIRLGNVTSYQRDNTLYYRAYPIDFRPPYPGLYTEKYYAEPFAHGNKKWHNLPISVDSPTLTIPKTGVRIRKMENVPYVDAASIISQQGNKVYVFVTNRNLKKSYNVEFDIKGRTSKIQVISQTPKNGNPFAEQTSWNGPNSFELKQFDLKPNKDGKVSLKMPPASFVRLEFTVEHKSK